VDFSADITSFYADFGVEATHRPAAGGPPATGKVILDQPGGEIFGGALITTDYTLRFPVATFQDVQKGDRFTLNRTDYVARESAQPLQDGLEATVPLAKTTP